MKNLFNWIAGVLFASALCAMLVLIAKDMAKANREDQVEKEECIVLKYQKEAEKFLDKGCDRYVRWIQ